MGSMNASPLTKLFICLQHHLPNNGTALPLPVLTTDIPQSLYSLGRRPGNSWKLGLRVFLRWKCDLYQFTWYQIFLQKISMTHWHGEIDSYCNWSSAKFLAILIIRWRILGLISSALRLLKLTCSSRLMIMLGFSSLRGPASLDPECYCARQHPVWRGFWFLFLWQCHQFMRPEKRSGNASRGGHDCNRTKSMKHLCFFVEYQTMSKWRHW